VLDLHWSAPGHVRAQMQGPMADADHSPRFWASVASTFRSAHGVVFDLYNEPTGVSWRCWLRGCDMGGWRSAGMQELVDAVRGSGARQPIVASGIRLGNDLSGWLSHRPRDPAGQLAAGFHVYDVGEAPYCATAACWQRTVAPVAARVPVVATEFGELDCRTRFIEPFMRWADRHGISYVAWAWNASLVPGSWPCAAGPSLIRSYSGEPTPYGRGFRDHLAALAR
jgi:endoglucanase